MSPNRRTPRTGASIAAVPASLGLLRAGVSRASRRLPAPPPARLPGGSPLCGRAAAWLGPSSPPACWRPYAASSPFNQKIPRGARVAPKSARVVRRLLSLGPLQHLTAGEAGRRTTSGARLTSTIPATLSSPCTARTPGGHARSRAGGSGSPTSPASPAAATATSPSSTMPAAGSTTSGECSPSPAVGGVWTSPGAGARASTATAWAPYRKTVLRAMARHGMYVADTGGSWGIVKESGRITTSFGLADRWVQLARAVHAPYWAPDRR
jgi:hypothetical protein